MKRIILSLLTFMALNAAAVGRLQNEDFKTLSQLTSSSATLTGNLTSGSPCIASPVFSSGALVNLGIGQFVYDTTTSANIPVGTTINALPGACAVGQIRMSANATATVTGDTITFGGQASSLLNDTKIYVTANNINDQLSNAIQNGRIGGAGGSGGINTLSTLNWDFEAGSANWTASGGTFSVSSTGKLFGSQSATWTPSGAQTFSSALVTTPTGLVGNNCSASVWTKWSGTSGALSVRVIDGSSNVLVTSFVPSSAAAQKTQIFFTCPTQMQVQLVSTGATSAVVSDNYILGQDALVTLQDTNPICTIIASTKTADFGDYMVADGRAISRATFSNYLTECGTVFGTGDGSTTVNLPDMRGRFLRGADINTNVAASGRDPDGGSRTAMNSGGATSVLLPGSVQGSQFGSHNHMQAITDPISGRTFQVIPYLVGTPTVTNSNFSFTGGTNTGGNSQVFEFASPSGQLLFNTGGNETRPINANVSYFIKVRGAASSQGLNLSTMGWRVDASISGANPSLGSATVSSYAGIENAALALANNTGMNIIPALLPCSGTNAPSGLTCSVGNGSVGVSFVLPTAGDIRACAQFTRQSILNTPSGTQVLNTFQLVETPNNAQTISQSGNEQASMSDINLGSTTNLYLPIKLCGNFSFTSAGQKTLRLMYLQTVTNPGSVGSEVVLGTAPQNIHWDISPINQNLPAPVSTDITAIKNNILYSGRNAIDGFQTSASGGTMTIGAGAAADSTNTVVINFPSALSKTLAAWTSGSGVGGLDTGSVAANTTYHVYVIQNAAQTLTDILFSTSPTTPVMPSGYIYRRRVFTMRTNGSAIWYPYTQFGGHVDLNTACETFTTTAGTTESDVGLTGCNVTGITARLRGSLYSRGIASSRVCAATIGPAGVPLPAFTLETEASNQAYYPSFAAGGHLVGGASLETHSTVAEVTPFQAQSGNIRIKIVSTDGGSCQTRFWLFGWDDFRGKDGLN